MEALDACNATKAHLSSTVVLASSVVFSSGSILLKWGDVRQLDKKALQLTHVGLIGIRILTFPPPLSWIDIDQLLAVFGITRDDLSDLTTVDAAIRRLSQRMPTYITIKDVKKRWGHAQEDVFPVAQFEKLWGDMTTMPDIDCSFFVTPMRRGQQLKSQAQLDPWKRDGTADYIESLCQWS